MTKTGHDEAVTINREIIANHLNVSIFNHILSSRKRNMLSHELTAEDIKKMEEEIEYRKVVVRKELLAHVKEARAHGDLSENFEYHAAKKEKNQNESRIRYLEKMIKHAKVIEDHSDADEVGLNKTITLFFEEDQEEDEYSIVTTVLTDPMNNRVSIESPVGKALMGHKIGDRVFIDVNPNYGYYVEIKNVRPFEEDVPINRY